MILECPNLDGAPANFFDDARVPLRAHRYNVADLERAIGLQRNSREEIAQCVL